MMLHGCMFLGKMVQEDLLDVRTTRTNEETVDPKELRKTKEEQKNEWTAKRKHGQFARDRVNKDTDNTWRWMRKGI